MAKPPVLQVRSGVIRGSEPRTVRGGKLPPVRTSAYATIGRTLMALLELLDMTDSDELQRVLLALIPNRLAKAEVPPLCAALRAAGAAALAQTIEQTFPLLLPSVEPGRTV